MSELWPHQIRYLARARELYRQGKRSILCCLPTGAGKTRLAVAIVGSSSSRGNRVLWIVHRAELVQQAADELREAGVPCGIIAPWAPRTWEPVQVASIKTLIARDLRPEANILVADEAHHLVAPTFFDVRKDYPEALVIGLTATPARADNVGLGSAFDCIVGEVQPRELITSGHLVPAIVKGPSQACDKLAAAPVDAYREHCAGRKAIVFCGSIKAASDLAAEFALAGIPARSVDGKMKDEDRTAAIAAFRRGSLQVLTNVHVLTEGFDVRETGAILLARKMGSEAAYIQACGRGMRRAEGKRDCIVVDLLGTSYALGILPDSDRVYSLEGKGVKASCDGAIAISQCRACGSVFRATVFADSRCPACGWVRPGRPDPTVERARISEIQARQVATASGQAKVEYLREQLVRCATMKKKDGTPYKPGAALIAFKARFHHWPTEAMRQAAGWPTGFRKTA